MLAQEFNLMGTERTNNARKWKQFKEKLENDTLAQTNHTCNIKSYYLNDTEYESTTLPL